MIKVDKNQIEISGTSEELLSEVTLAIKALCRESSRDFIMQTLLTGIYTLPDENGGKMDMVNSIEKLKKDVSFVLNVMGQLSDVDGKTTREACETLKDKIEERRNK